MKNAELIASLVLEKGTIQLRIKDLRGHLKNIDAVIEILTLLLPKEVALRAINKAARKNWTPKEIAGELAAAHDERKLDTRGLEGKKWMQISHNVLTSLFRSGNLERVRLLIQRSSSPFSPHFINSSHIHLASSLAFSRHRLIPYLSSKALTRSLRQKCSCLFRKLLVSGCSISI